MKWHREIDYHGTRSYGADAPALSALSITMAWFFDISRRKWRNLTMRARSSRVLFEDGERSFSLLGRNSRRPAARDTANGPLPMKSRRANHRDWRVLP